VVISNVTAQNSRLSVCEIASYFATPCTWHIAGPPVWLHTVDDDIFEPLGTSASLPLPEDMVLSEDSSTRDIGDWGEQLVKNYLEAVVVSYRKLC